MTNSSSNSSGNTLPPPPRSKQAAKVWFSSREPRSDISPEMRVCSELQPGEWVEFPPELISTIRSRLARKYTEAACWTKDLNYYVSDSGSIVVINGPIPEPTGHEIYEIHSGPPPAHTEARRGPKTAWKYQKIWDTIQALKPGEWFEVEADDKLRHSMAQSVSRQRRQGGVKYHISILTSAKPGHVIVFRKPEA